MKTVNAIAHKRTIFCIILFLGSAQFAEAQLFKKSKNKRSKREKVETKMHVSDSSRTFQDWDEGELDIVAYVVSEFDAKKRTHIVGKIKENGSFSYALPDSIATSVPISAFAEACTNTNTASIKNPEVKVALVKLYTGKNKEFTGNLHMVNPVEAVYNLGGNKEHNGELGATYLLVYADGNASISINCIKEITMRNKKGQAYKDKLKAESTIAIDLKKGWNILHTDVKENIPNGTGLHFTKNELTVVAELPNDVKWVFQEFKN